MLTTSPGGRQARGKAQPSRLATRADARPSVTPSVRGAYEIADAPAGASDAAPDAAGPVKAAAAAVAADKPPSARAGAATAPQPPRSALPALLPRGAGAGVSRLSHTQSQSQLTQPTTAPLPRPPSLQDTTQPTTASVPTAKHGVRFADDVKHHSGGSKGATGQGTGINNTALLPPPRPLGPSIFPGQTRPQATKQPPVSRSTTPSPSGQAPGPGVAGGVAGGERRALLTPPWPRQMAGAYQVVAAGPSSRVQSVAEVGVYV